MAREDPGGLRIEPGLSARGPLLSLSLSSPSVFGCHPRWLLVWGAVTLRLDCPQTDGRARSLAVSLKHSVENPSKLGRHRARQAATETETGGGRLAWTAALHGLCFHDVREAELRVPQIREATALPSIRAWRQH